MTITKANPLSAAACFVVIETKEIHEYERVLTNRIACIVPLDFFHACTQVTYLDDRLAEYFLEARIRDGRVKHSG